MNQVDGKKASIELNLTECSRVSNNFIKINPTVMSAIQQLSININDCSILNSNEIPNLKKLRIKGTFPDMGSFVRKEDS